LLLLRLFFFFFFFFFTTPHQSCFLQAIPGHCCPPSTIDRFPNPSRFRSFLLSFFLRSAQAKTSDASSGINFQKLLSKFPKSPAAAAAAAPPPATVAAVLLLPPSLENPFPLHQTSPGNSCKSEQLLCGKRKKRLKNHTQFFAQILQTLKQTGIEQD
jgi:hypothetical protein